MKYSFFRKMLRWPPSASDGKRTQKGTLTLLAAFLFIVFSALGMGMLYVSQVYLKTSGYKLNAMILEYASENGIKQGYHNLLAALSNLPNPSLLSEQEMENYRLDALQGGTKMVDRLHGTSPTHLESSWEKMSWESREDWALDYLEPRDDYPHPGPRQTREFPPGRRSKPGTGDDRIGRQIASCSIPGAPRSKPLAGGNVGFQKKQSHRTP
jgi:hypothetical protein